MPDGKRIRQRYFCKNVLHEIYSIKFKFENYMEEKQIQK